MPLAEGFHCASASHHMAYRAERSIGDMRPLCAPLEEIPVDYARRLNGIYAAMQEAGVSVDTAHAATMLVTTPLDSLLEKALQRAHYGDVVDIPKLAETIRKTVQSEAANEQR